MCVSMPNTSFPQHATPPHPTPPHAPTGHLYRRLRIACQSEDNECVSKKEGQKKRDKETDTERHAGVCASIKATDCCINTF